MKCTLTTLRKGASLQNKQFQPFMTKTEIYYIYYKYILGFLSKNLVSAKEANFERNVSISFLLVINKSLRVY